MTLNPSTSTITSFGKTLVNVQPTLEYSENVNGVACPYDRLTFVYSYDPIKDRA